MDNDGHLPFTTWYNALTFVFLFLKNVIDFYFMYGIIAQILLIEEPVLGAR